jgi:hypothetical protein
MLDITQDELRTKEFNRIIDHYLTTGTMNAEDYESLTQIQKTVIQTIKRSFARITSHEN